MSPSDVERRQGGRCGGRRGVRERRREARLQLPRRRMARGKMLGVEGAGASCGCALRDVCGAPRTVTASLRVATPRVGPAFCGLRAKQITFFDFDLFSPTPPRVTRRRALLPARATEPEDHVLVLDEAAPRRATADDAPRGVATTLIIVFRNQSTALPSFSFLLYILLFPV